MYEIISQIITVFKTIHVLRYYWTLFMVLEVAMDLIQPTIMQHIIDVGIANRDMNYVIKWDFL